MYCSTYPGPKSVHANPTGRPEALDEKRSPEMKFKSLRAKLHGENFTVGESSRPEYTKQNVISAQAVQGSDHRKQGVTYPAALKISYTSVFRAWICIAVL